MKNITIGEYTRISKNEAHKRHAAGDTVYAVPVNVNPTSKWMQPAAIPTEGPNASFTKFIAEYERCNCTMAETGRYAAFYVKE